MSHSKKVSQTTTNLDRPSIEQNDNDIRIPLDSDDTLSSSSLMHLTKNEKLLTALAKQMNYYFSEQNLAQDTYLNTIMGLNSGYVPIAILGGFANINRIIARFAAEANVDMALLDPLFVMSLLRQSLYHAEELEIVVLNQSGKVVVSQQDQEQEQQKEQQHDEQQHQQHSIQGDEELGNHKKSPIVLEAIGRKSKCNSSRNNHNLQSGDGRVTADEDVDEAGKKDTFPMTNVGGTSNKENVENSTRSNTVILREVSTDATEEDVRGVFECDDNSSATSPIITKIQKEVGQCWFVTMDPSTSQQDMVSILLNLRNKKLCNDPIKARLKTASAATRDAPRQVSDVLRYCTYHKSDASRNGKIYTGDRVNYSLRDSNKLFSKPRGGKGADHQHGFNKKSYAVEARKLHKGDEKKTSHPAVSSSPPPPFVEEHFPGLSGSVPIEMSTDSMRGDEKELPRETSNSITGYAAALLKAAPPVTEVSTKANKKSSAELPKATEAKVRCYHYVCLFTFFWFGVMTQIFVSLSTRYNSLCVYSCIRTV